MKRNIKRMLAVFLLIAVSVIAGDWTTWRGPQSNSMSNETGWSDQALLGVPKMLWKAELGMGHSCFTVQGKRLYTIGEKQVTTATDTVAEEIVYCMDANTGKLIWRYGFLTQRVRWPGPASTPVLNDASLYYLSREGIVFSFDAETGNVNWRRDLVAEEMATYIGWGFCASPHIENNLVILNVGKSGLALDKRTGDTVWFGEAGPGWVASPTAFDMNGKRVAALISDAYLNVVDLNTGELQWAYPWNSDADPTILGSRMLLIGGHQNPGAVMLDYSTGQPEEVWKSRFIRHTFQNPVIIDGYAYTFGYLRNNRDEPFICFNIENGEVAWSEVLGEFNAQGALMAAGGKLVILNVDGNLIIADPSSEGLKTMSEAQIFNLNPYNSYPNGEPDCCWTAPVLANGKLYARTTYGAMVCIDMK